MKKIFFIGLVLAILSGISYSCDNDQNISKEEQDTEGTLLLKDKFGINSIDNELINPSDFIEFPDKTKSTEEEYVYVLNYEDGGKAYIIPREEEKYTIVLYDGENNLKAKKDFEIIYDEEGQVINYAIKEHDPTNVKFYRLEGESFADCVDRAWDDVMDTLWGKAGALVPGGAASILSACAVSCI
ncbi:hypothetical protein DF185_21800 [Marinifilum breve]|uniref:Uncharacterized protein n=1 Tax=Marinifilum breve TaxID=2184082 RepID=A0A2V3ZS90_9BACT|nr:hypothetical protein [Marinifilum breve]PXX95729.1 hypothetical protein DF185_21800 [Marinifilum breve]